MSRVRWQREVPEELSALDTLDRPDYTDWFTATAREAPPRPAEAWLRAMLDSSPGPLRRFIVVVQRSLLGLHLESRPSPDHLLGWRIAARGDDWVRIEAASWFMTGHVLFHLEGRRLSVGTFVRYDRPVARLVWPPVSLIHRQVGFALMRHALRSTG